MTQTDSLPLFLLINFAVVPVYAFFLVYYGKKYDKYHRSSGLASCGRVIWAVGMQRAIAQLLLASVGHACTFFWKFHQSFTNVCRTLMIATLSLAIKNPTAYMMADGVHVYATES